jgi:hypothetical protein
MGTDVKICRAIARSQSNELTVKEIIEFIRPKNNSIYKNIHSLASQSGETWDSKYLFSSTLINDLINKKNNGNEEIDRIDAQSILDEEINKIAHKLELLYYSNDSENVKLDPRFKSNDEDNMNIIIFESNKRARAKIILNKSAVKTKDSAFLTIDNRNIPLTWIHKEHRIYFKPLKFTSTAKGELDWLRCMTSNEGLERIYKYKRKIRKISNSKNISDGKKDRLIQGHYQKIRKIYDNIRYRKLSLNSKSLLFYALQENNYVEFNKSIECLSNLESDIVHETVRQRHFNEFGEEDGGIYHSFSFKRDFPYLSKYTLTKDYLPRNFVAKLLKETALELNNKLHDLNGEEISYEITCRLIKAIKTSILISNDTKTRRSQIENYLREIGTYLVYIDLRADEIKKQNENWKNIYEKESNLRETLFKLIDEGINRNDEVIPIHEPLQRIKILWDSELNVLRSIANRYGNRFLITGTCLVRKFKARKLKALLRKKPTPQQANSLLIEKGGIHEECLNYEFLTKLGFYIDITRPDYTHQFVTEIKKNRSARE